MKWANKSKKATPPILNKIKIFVILALSLLLLVTFVPQISASVLRTETITVYGINGLPYVGASVQIYSWNPESKSKLMDRSGIVRTNSNGVAVLSFSSKADYAGLAVQPPASDTTTSIFYQDLYMTNAGSDISVHLNPATIRVEMQRPDGTSLSADSCIDVPTKIPGYNESLRTLRSGEFGIYLDSSISTSIKNNSINIYACSPLDADLGGSSFRTVKNSNGTFTIYGDYLNSQVLNPENGVYKLKIESLTITGQIQRSDGTIIDGFSENNFINVSSMPVLDNGDYDVTNWSNNYLASSVGKWGLYQYSPHPGQFEIRYSDSGKNPIPSYIGSKYWVDEYGKISLTKNGTYSKSINFLSQIPTSNLIKLLIKSDGNVSNQGGNVKIIRKQSDSSWQDYLQAGIGQNGFAVMSIPDGEYQLLVNPNYQGTAHPLYFLTVISGSPTIKDVNGNSITKTSDYFELGGVESNIKISPISPSDSSSVSAFVSIVKNFDGSGDWAGETFVDTTSVYAKFKLEDGEYQIRISPDYLNQSDWTTTTYKLSVTGGVQRVENDVGIVSATAGIYKLPMKSTFFSGTIYNSNRNDFVRFTQVIATNIANPSSKVILGYSDAMGHYNLNFGSPIRYGVYSIQAIPDPYHGAGQGSSLPILETITANSGKVNLDIYLRTANVIGTVMGPKSESPDNSITITNINSSGNLITSNIYPQTNKSGTFYAYLDPDTYTLKSNSDMWHAGGGSGSTICKVPNDSSTVTTCDITLPAPNVSGTITVGGVDPVNVQIGLFLSLSESAKWQWNYKSDPWSGFSGDNTYKVNVTPGTYRLWINYIDSNKNNITIPGPLCVVPSSGNVVCNVTLPAPNFSFKVVDTNGLPLPQASVSIGYKENNGYFNTCCNTLTSDSMTVPLMDGSYKVSIQGPNSLSRGLGQDYFFDVSNGKITNPHLLNSTENISPMEGIFTLSAKLPSISGIVYQPDGVTPAVGVSLSIDSGSRSGIMQWVATTDNHGRFGIDIESYLGYLPSSVLDGVYKIQAVPNQGTYGSSSWSSFTLSKGKSSTDLSLVLRKPNVFGTVSGPKGASKYSYVQLTQVSASGKYNYLGGTATDENGKFAFALDIGNYLLSTSGNLAATGGTSVNDQSCKVLADTPTVTTCNIALPAPNITGTITLDSSTVSYGSIFFAPDSTINGNTAINEAGVWGEIGSAGTFGFTAKPGTYFSSVGFQNGNTWAWNPGTSCVVSTDTSTGNVCDIAFPKTNLEIDIKDKDGNSANNMAWLMVQRVKSGQTLSGIGGSSSWDGGPIKYSLFDGSYKLYVRSNDPSKGIGQNYSFDVTSGIVSNFKIDGTATILSGVGDVFTVSLKAPPLSGVVYETDGLTPASNYQVQATFVDPVKGAMQTYWGSTYGAGQFSIDLGQNPNNGSYKIQAFPYSGLNHGSSNISLETVTAGVGSQNIKLILRAPNVQGTVSGPKGISPGNWLNIQKVEDNGSINYLQYGVMTDAEGKFALALDSGKYKFITQSDIQNAGGAATTSEICTVSGISLITCNITLKAPNLTGKITRTGNPINAWINLFQVTDKGIVWTNNSVSTNSDGSFGFFVTPGKYRAQIYDYQGNINFTGPECNVTDSETVCDINIPATNLILKVKNYSLNGDAEYGGANTSMNLGGIYQFWSWLPNSGTDSNTELRASLLPGEYQISVWPRNQKDGAPRNFKATVVGDSVTSLIDLQTLETFTATNGIFTIGYAAPSIAGSVVAPDGTTPVPYAYIDAFNLKLCTWCGYGGGTDSSGYFAFANMDDGQYTLIAHPPYRDATKGDSLPQQVTVTNGRSSGNTKLTLQTPNVTGVVRGPNGISANNWVQVQHRLSDGSWEWPQYIRNVNTDNNGNFAFTLPVGTYRFLAGSDSQGSGGGPGQSGWCDVPVSGTVQCDINLAAPNFKFVITAPGSASSLSNTWAWIYLASGGNSVANWNPQISLNISNIFETTLEDGIWILKLQPPYNISTLAPKDYRITVSGGLVTQVVDLNNNAKTPTDSIYFLPLDGSNLTGTVKANNSTYSFGSNVSVLRFNGYGYYYWYNTWSSDGTFGFKLPVGKYKIEATPYYGYGDFAGYTTTRSEECVVVDSGSITCDINLKKPNLSAQVKTPSGDTFRYAYIYLESIDSKNISTYQYVNLQGDGSFSVYLPDGTYTLRLIPYWDYQSKYAERQYSVTVQSGVVTSIINSSTGLALTPNAGIYNLVVATPSISGKVITPESTPTGASNVQILVGESGSYGKWMYSTQTDASGNYGLTVPDGTYVIQAIPWNGKIKYGKSETHTVTVLGQTVADTSTLTLILRSPNFNGRVVDPNTLMPISNVNVNAWISNEYFYAFTGDDGKFAFFVDNASPNCPTMCSIDLNPNNSTEYWRKSTQLSSIGNVGDLSIGLVNTHVTVNAPHAGRASTLNSYGQISVLYYDTITSNNYYISGSYTNNIGVAGLYLEPGKHYKLTAYPGNENNGLYSPKSVDIPSFSPSGNSTIEINFDLPNLTINSTGTDSGANSHGWWTINNNYDSVTGLSSPYLNGYFNELGTSSFTLSDGAYQLIMHPGPFAAGIDKKLNFKMVSGAPASINETVTVLATGDSISGNSLNLVLSGGNISGIVRDDTGTALGKILVSATRSDSTTVTVSTDKTGWYQMNLDLTYDWTIKAVNPDNLASGTTSVAHQSPSNAVINTKNITIR